MLAVALTLLGLSALAGIAAPMRIRLLPVTSWLLSCAAAVLLVVTGARGLVGDAGQLSLGTVGELGAANLRVDALSGMFLVIAFGVAIPVLLAGATTAAAERPRLPGLIAATLAAVAIILTADNLFVFLFGWEGLTFAFFLLTGFDRARADRAWPALLTGVFGKTSGSLLLLGGAVLAAHAGTIEIAGFGAHPGGASQAGYALLLAGFAIKIGLAPAQVWLPSGYAKAAPAARAVMAGVAVNVGFYGMWRTLEVMGRPPAWLAGAVLLLGGATAILGIAHAAVHADLAYLIAWSSVENAGVITAGYGVALLGATAGSVTLTAAGLVAATAQVCAHALGKSLLFVSAGALQADFGTTSLERLRGVFSRTPYSGLGLAVGAWTLAGLPLAAGFASEWLILQALMQQFRVRGLALHLAAATAGALVALTVGVAAVTFVRLIGFAVLGPTGAALRLAPHAVDRQPGHRAAVVLLAAGCLGLAVVAPLEIRVIATGLGPVIGRAGFDALDGPWVIQPVYGGFSALSPSWLWIIIPGLALLIAGVGMSLSGRRMLRIRRVPAWSSASPGVDRPAGYTSYGFANPMRKLLTNLLLTRAELRHEELRSGGQVGAENAGAAGVRLGYTIDVVDIVRRYLYRPGRTVILKAARAATRLQSGRLGAYLTYMLIALIAVVAVAAATA